MNVSADFAARVKHFACVPCSAEILFSPTHTTSHPHPISNPPHLPNLITLLPKLLLCQLPLLITKNSGTNTGVFVLYTRDF
jgi:hypothetical protein